MNWSGKTKQVPNKRKGIVLAGGKGSRMYPTTLVTSKQLLPVYDKPTIYYPLSVLQQAGISDILIITKENDLAQFKKLLGNGQQWSLNLSYKVQPNPNGIAQAFVLAEEFLNGAPSILILGDNIFYGKNLGNTLIKASSTIQQAVAFTIEVDRPEDFGVVTFNEDGSIHSIIEKPHKPQSKFALTGLYFVDHTAPNRAKTLKPSKRGEYEITDLLRSYWRDEKLSITILDQQNKWLDTGTPDSLLHAANFVERMKSLHNIEVGALERASTSNRIS